MRPTRCALVTVVQTCALPIYSLGFGSGLDVKQLVTDLSNASREPKIARVTELTQTNQTRISALAQARADLDGFADSLSQMVNDGTLRSTPTVSDEKIGRAHV